MLPYLRHGGRFFTKPSQGALFRRLNIPKSIQHCTCSRTTGVCWEWMTDQGVDSYFYIVEPSAPLRLIFFSSLCFSRKISRRLPRSKTLGRNRGGPFTRPRSEHGSCGLFDLIFTNVAKWPTNFSIDRTLDDRANTTTTS